MPEIKIQNLKVEYPTRKKNPPVVALENMDVTFETDTFNVICGYSGCGKTTLLRAIAGLQDYEGDIFIDNVDATNLTIAERHIAYVSQNYVLYPHMTVFDNIANPLKLSGATREEVTQRVKEVAEILGLTHCLSRKPKQLSGGQQQRVALARAIVKRPSFYLFDEPLSNVDVQSRSAARIMIRNCVKAFGSTAIYVTHDFTEAMALADKLFIVNNGKIEISGTPIDVYNSGNEVVEDLKSMGSFGDIEW